MIGNILSLQEEKGKYYLQAVLSEIPRKNGWQIAEHARQARPYGIQRLLSRAVWDQDGVRDDLRAQVVQRLDMVDNSRNLCKSSLGLFFRQWVVQTGHLTLE